VEDRVSIVPTATEENSGYLDTKRDKLGHLLAS
jgi:GTP cyclohydrolase II